MEILSSIRYLARQRLPFRIHNELNFRQLLLLQAEVDPSKTNKSISFTSHSKWNVKRYDNAYS